MTSLNPFTDKTLRSVYDSTSGGYWFSVTDLFAILTESDHKKARGYWKRLKYRTSHAKNQVVTVSHHLKWQAPNGKFHYTEAVDFKNLVRLIQICPSPKANMFRLWLADTLLEGFSAKQIEDELAKLGEDSARLAAQKHKDGEQNLRMVTQSKDINQVRGNKN